MAQALILARLVHFAAVMILFGSSLFAVYAAAGWRAPAERAAFALLAAWLRRLLAAGAVLGLVSAVAWLALVTAAMNDDPRSAYDVPALRMVLTETAFGGIWTIHLILAASLVLLLALPFASRYPRRTVTAVVGLSGVLAVTQGWVGHPAGVEGLAGAIDLVARPLHLLAAAAWLGGLLPLSFVLAKARGDHFGPWERLTRIALRRFSLMGMIAVGLIVLTGLFRSWFLVGTLDALLHTGYGRVLLLKFTFFAGMVGLAAINRLRLTPRLAAASALEENHDPVLTALYRNVLVEQGLGLLVLAVVSVLGTLPPAAAGG